jgi:hypothetical protein
LDRHVSILLEIDYALGNGGHLLIHALGIGLLVPALLRRADSEGRRVDVVDAGLKVLGIEEGALLLFAGLLPWHLWKPACWAGIDGGSFAFQKDGVDGLSLEEKVPAPEIYIGPDAQGGFTESRDGQ